MGAFTRGSVVLVQFPFSDLSQTKLRPAVVLAAAEMGDYVLCQITSNAYGGSNVELTQADFARGSLQRTSYARPAKLFTASDQLIKSEVGVLSPPALTRIVDVIVKLLRDIR